MQYRSTLSSVSQVETHVDIGMHGVLAKHVDAKLFPRFGEPKQSIERDDIGEDSPALIEVRHVKESQRHIPPGSVRQLSILRPPVMIVDPLMLMVKRLMEHRAPRSPSLEHAANKALEFDISGDITRLGPAPVAAFDLLESCLSAKGLYRHLLGLFCAALTRLGPG